MAHLRSEPGVGTWPNGTEYYKAVLQWYLTLDMDPEEVHQIGLQEVERIQKRMENVSKCDFCRSTLNFLLYLKDL
jgi:uncharacterized protein (DUF885 family)